MSRRKKPTTEDYLRLARELAPFAPGLRRYRRRKTLKPWEKAHIARIANALRYTDHLKPLNKKQWKKYKDVAYIPTNKKTGKPIKGIHAIRLGGLSPNAQISSISKDMLISSNGKTWLLWKLEKLNTRAWKTKRVKVFGDAAETYFNLPISEAFPIEKVKELVEEAFRRIPKQKEIHLWTRTGVVPKGFLSIGPFMDWLLSEHVAAYKNTDDWINGIAILIYNNQ